MNLIVLLHGKLNYPLIKSANIFIASRLLIISISCIPATAVQGNRPGPTGLRKIFREFSAKFSDTIRSTSIRESKDRFSGAFGG